MPSMRLLLVVATLGAAAFGLGHWVGGQRASEPAFELDSAREALLDVARAATRTGQTEAFVPVLMRMEPADFPALAPTVESRFVVGGAGRAGALFVERWATLDPDAAYARVSAWPPDRQREVLPGLLRAWARSDPARALEALEAIGDASQRALAHEGLVEGWADSGDAGVWTHLVSVEPYRRRQQFAVIAMHSIATRDGLDAVLERLQALPAEGARDEMMGTGADVVARIDLPRAVRFADGCTTATYCGDVTNRVAIRWAGVDGPAMLEWLLSMPAGERRDLAMYAGYSAWLRRDREASVAWLSDHLAEPGVAPAVRARARPFARANLPLAVRWASGLEDPELRRQAQIEIGRIWRRKNDAEAERWLSDLGLSEAVPRRPGGAAATD